MNSFFRRSMIFGADRSPKREIVFRERERLRVRLRERD